MGIKNYSFGPAKLELSTNTDSTADQERADESDVYVLLQGPAHIIIKADGTISVAFLDDEKKRKQPITLIPSSEGDTKILKVTFLDLIVECDKDELKILEDNGELGNFFPKTFHEIVKTTENIAGMTSTGPPFTR